MSRYKLLLIDEGCYVLDHGNNLPFTISEAEIAQYFIPNEHDLGQKYYHAIVNGNAYFCIKDRASFEIIEVPDDQI